MHQGRYFSSALLLLFASIMIGFVAPPVLAAEVHLFRSKEEALDYCNNIKVMIEGGEYSTQAKYTYDVVYPDQQGNDVFYNCGYQEEQPTDVNRSKKDCSRDSMKYKDTPERGVRYECLWDGRWVLVDCNEGAGRLSCIPLELQEYVKNHPELVRTLLKRPLTAADVFKLQQALPELYIKSEEKLVSIYDAFSSVVFSRGTLTVNGGSD